MVLQKKGAAKNSGAFSLRIKFGEYEIELSGDHNKVMATAKRLPELVSNISTAFNGLKPKTVATITVNTDKVKSAKPVETTLANQKYPKIQETKRADQALLRILESDWGKWRPRTLQELREALQANQLKFSDRTFATALDKISKKGQVRRWNTSTGFVYILAEQKR